MHACGMLNIFQTLSVPASEVPNQEEKAEMMLMIVGRVLICGMDHFVGSDLSQRDMYPVGGVSAWKWPTRRSGLTGPVMRLD